MKLAKTVYSKEGETLLKVYVTLKDIHLDLPGLHVTDSFSLNDVATAIQRGHKALIVHLPLSALS